MGLGEAAHRSWLGASERLGSAAMTPVQGARVNRSWLLGEQDGLVSSLQGAAMILFGIGGLALLFGVGWWGAVVVTAAAVSLLVVALFPLPNLWVAAPVVINVALLMGVLGWSWPDLGVFGG